MRLSPLYPVLEGMDALLFSAIGTTIDGIIRLHTMTDNFAATMGTDWR
jgi:hypothetical protein